MAVKVLSGEIKVNMGEVWMARVETLAYSYWVLNGGLPASGARSVSAGDMFVWCDD